MEGFYVPELYDSRVVEMNGRGMNDQQIGLVLGIHPHTIGKERIRLRLAPVSTTPPARRRSGPSNKSAIQVAAETLPRFNAEAMTLDGRPVKLPDLMKATNRRLKQLGKAQCLYSPEWLQ